MERKRKIDFDITDINKKATTDTTSSSSSTINPWTHRSYSSKYYEILTKRKQLPVYEFKDALEKAVKENQVVIVEGETGSGRCYSHIYLLLLLFSFSFFPLVIERPFLIHNLRTNQQHYPILSQMIR